MVNVEMIQIIKNLDNTKIKLSESCGPAILVEIRMRLIGQFSKNLREKLIELYNKNRDNKRRYHTDKYWDCNLVGLTESIIEVYRQKLEKIEINDIEKFREWRNKFFHGDYITNLVNFIGIEATGREILKNGRNNLEPSNIKDAIINISNNSASKEFEILSNRINSTLDEKIIYHLDPKENFSNF